VGLVALIAGLSVLAGLCAFAIEYDEGTRRFTKQRARRRALTIGLVAASFFAALGLLLDLALLR
jgi:hypothetical protein